MDFVGLDVSRLVYSNDALKHIKKLNGFSPLANYTDRAIAAGQRS
jgi:hypothetical protein